MFGFSAARSYVQKHTALLLLVQAIASEAGVRGMPTFQTYFNGAKVGEVVGANPAGLKDLVEKCVQRYANSAFQRC